MRSLAQFIAQNERSNGVGKAQTLKAVLGKKLNGAVLASLIAIVTVIIAGLYLFITIFYDSGGSWNPLEILTTVHVVFRKCFPQVFFLKFKDVFSAWKRIGIRFSALRTFEVTALLRNASFCSQFNLNFYYIKLITV